MSRSKEKSKAARLSVGEALTRFFRGKAGSSSVPAKLMTYLILTGLGFELVIAQS